jgi:hypothetical protein
MPVGEPGAELPVLPPVVPPELPLVLAPEPPPPPPQAATIIEAISASAIPRETRKKTNVMGWMS